MRDHQHSAWSEMNLNKSNGLVLIFTELVPKIKPILNLHKIRISECGKLKLKHQIGGSKDKIDNHKQSGIYSIKYSHCNMEYIGQTRWSILKRFKEHQCHIAKNEQDESSVARHMLSFIKTQLLLILTHNSSYL